MKVYIVTALSPIDEKTWIDSVYAKKEDAEFRKKDNDDRRCILELKVEEWEVTA
jgi:hypothetical protein